jgi:uncharacterized protein DUF4384
MRKLTTLAMISFAAIVLIATVVPAQGPKPQTKAIQNQKGDSDEVLSRAIRQKVLDKRIDGMEIVVFDVKDGKLTPILDPSRNFRKDDEIKVQFWSNFDGYVYFVNVEPSGKKTVIYPQAGGKEQSNMILGGQHYILPHSLPYVFDEEKGIEVIQVIMSRQPIRFLDDAVKKSNGELGKTASNVADELVGVGSKKKGIDSDTIAKVLPNREGDAVRSRKVSLARPRDTEQGTVIAVPDSLKDGGIAVFEIRLQHNM